MTPTRLIELRKAKPRFARSINVERDFESDAIDGYLPVGRAIDVLARFAAALDRDDVEVAFSVTGPYGSGKSSLALMLDALLGPARSSSRAKAESLLEDVAPQVLERLTSARARLGAGSSGFIRAVVTAQREPIVTTVLRALDAGAQRFTVPAKSKAKFTKLQGDIAELLAGALGDRANRPGSRDVRSVITRLGEFSPVLLLIDEFGKNLEAFADSRSDADLFLLQDLAEWSRGGDGIPLALVTLQHLAFDEYADTASSAQRREWSKIQGRFEDVAFIDSPSQTRGLIAAAFSQFPKQFEPQVSDWAHEQALVLLDAGLDDIGKQEKLIAACWPLHPVVLAALPDLCQRYGQNERTLFSFLAGHEPLGVMAFLEAEELPDQGLPSVRLDRVYDYFIESASNMASVSINASRWVEIDLRVRDATAISVPARRVLKTIGLLNLISAGGALRASAAALVAAAADGCEGTQDAAAVKDRIAELEDAGLVTYRSFVDEYRIWQGSDFDLRAAIDSARGRMREQPLRSLLRSTLPLTPIVAGRHSYETGTLRAFERDWVTPDEAEVLPLGIDDLFDGSALYVLGPDPPIDALRRFDRAKPLVFAATDNPAALIDAAVEVAAIDEILGVEGPIKDDWVAWRELRERRIEAHIRLRQAFFDAFGDGSATWWGEVQGTWSSSSSLNSSHWISGVCSEAYELAPIIKNDLMNRHELSSQASKARRVLAERMVRGQAIDGLGIEGFGPEMTLYLSLLRAHGLHDEREGAWGFSAPPKESSLRPVWDAMLAEVEQPGGGRIRVDDLYRSLAAPPFGLRAGIAPIILIAMLLAESDQIALYEHGTFRPVLGDDVLERLLKNPVNFELKHFGTRRGPRAEFIRLLRDALGLAAPQRSRQRSGGVLPVVAHLVQQVNLLPDYSRRTRTVGAQAVALRGAIRDAVEPDILLFESIPEAFGAQPIGVSDRRDAGELEMLATDVASASSALTSAFHKLIDFMRAEVSKSCGVKPRNLKTELSLQAASIQAGVTDDRMRRLLVALCADIPDEEGWLTYIGMNVVGSPPEGWGDEEQSAFGARINELGAQLQRTYLLNQSVGDLAADAMRLVATRSSGEEVVLLVELGPTTNGKAKKALEDAAKKLASESDISQEQAKQAILGAAINDLGH